MRVIRVPAGGEWGIAVTSSAKRQRNGKRFSRSRKKVLDLDRDHGYDPVQEVLQITICFIFRMMAT
jgi:hypothetical protein